MIDRYRDFEASTGLNTPSLLVIRDSDQHIFGVFSNVGWRKQTKDFYGTPECFVFKLFPQISFYHTSRVASNNHFIFSHPTGIGIGGDRDFHAIWIDSYLDRGHSQPSVTFRNPSLSASLDFRCQLVELWGLIPGRASFTSQK
jgi:hypothetical protein